MIQIPIDRIDRIVLTEYGETLKVSDSVFDGYKYEDSKLPEVQWHSSYFGINSCDCDGCIDGDYDEEQDMRSHSTWSYAEIGRHEVCEGKITLHNVSSTHNVLRCNVCGLRILIPNTITTYGALLEHFSKNRQV